MFPTARILLVDDTPENLDILIAILEDLECQLIVANNGERALELASKQFPDLILLDIMMPGMNGFEVCAKLKSTPATRDIPIIFVTARTQDISVGFSAGGSDYITKPINADEVRARVRYQLERKHLTEELQKLNKSLEQKVRERTAELSLANQQLRAEINERRYIQDRLNYLATHDFVTRLYNRSSLESHVNALLAKIQLNQTKATFLLIDIDRFRVINESCGCIAGDELLRQFSENLGGLLDSNDFFARLGSDKFAAVTESSSADNGMALAKSIVNHLNNMKFKWDDHEFTLGASIAVLPLANDIASFDQVMLLADEILYLAKRDGRGLVRGFNEIARRNVEEKENVNWALRLVNARKNNLFRLHFQLIHELVDTQPNAKRQLRIETLVRMWDPNAQRLIPPNDFIGPAERLHFISELDSWVIENVFKFLADHPDLFEKLSCVAINISTLSLREAHFSDLVVGLIHQYKIPPQIIGFEITETQAIVNLEIALQFIERLKKLGCNFSLDDFGSGFASYAYLHKLSFDTLKIDGVFVRDMDREPYHFTMVKAITEMASSMNKEIVAEFVENEIVAKQLRGLGVRWAQGYLYHKPQELTYDNLIEHLND